MTTEHKSKVQLEHEARLAAIRKEGEERRRAQQIKFDKAMAVVETRLAVVKQRNLEGLVAWLEQEATPEQVETIISKINQGEI